MVEKVITSPENVVYFATAREALADLAERLGSEEAARKAVGNLNNLIALRSKDRPTQDFVVETFGKTPIHSIDVSIGTHTDELKTLGEH